MQSVKTISDIPPAKLQQLVEDLGYEGVVRDAIKVMPQSDGKLRLEYSPPSKSGPSQSGGFNPPSGFRK